MSRSFPNKTDFFLKGSNAIPRLVNQMPDCHIQWNCYITAVKNIRIAILLIFLAGIYLAWVNWQSWMPFKPEGNLADSVLTQRGQFGDSYGALNTLFAGVAFAVVLYSLFVQQWEANQREKERHEDAVEQRFYRMIESYRSHVASFSHGESSGKSVFLVYLQRLKKIPTLPEEKILSFYGSSIVSNFQSRLGPYFRLVYRTVAKIDESLIPDKEDLIELLRAKLSEAEVVFLAYNGLTDQGKKFKPLMIKYSLLKHIPGNWTTCPMEFFKKHYPPMAFGLESFENSNFETLAPEEA